MVSSQSNKMLFAPEVFIMRTHSAGAVTEERIFSPTNVSATCQHVFTARADHPAFPVWFRVAFFCGVILSFHLHGLLAEDNSGPSSAFKYLEIESSPFLEALADNPQIVPPPEAVEEIYRFQQVVLEALSLDGVALERFAGGPETPYRQQIFEFLTNRRITRFFDPEMLREIQPAKLQVFLEHLEFIEAYLIPDYEHISVPLNLPPDWEEPVDFHGLTASRLNVLQLNLRSLERTVTGNIVVLLHDWVHRELGDTERLRDKIRTADVSEKTRESFFEILD